MKIAVVKEVRDYETRVAATPETVAKFAKLGAGVVVQSGAGTSASYTDDAYSEAGAEIAKDFASTVKGADVVLKVLHPTEAEVGQLSKGQKLFAIMAPYDDREITDKLAEKGVEAYAMEFMPRITRAQSMDVLSSQSNLAGYKAVIEAANLFSKALPQMMTAAGTVSPAKIFVMGAGVAGLQAIATAKRLGAVVSATDVRPDTEEQVKSLGGKFIAVKNDEFKQAQTSGGYAKEMSDDYKKQQAELVAEHITAQDIVITTALIPGRKAPVLIDNAMIATMKPGSVIVDLAVERGGNVEGAELDQIVEMENGVLIMGLPNMAGRVPGDASSLFARNHYNFLSPFIKEGALAIDDEDELVKGTRLSKDGKIVHPRLGGGDEKKDDEPEEEPKPSVKKASSRKPGSKTTKRASSDKETDA